MIRYSDTFLSAYRNNNTILVKVGGIVLRGNKIATMGENVSSAYLHFKIRKNGNSIDPRKFLPLNFGSAHKMKKAHYKSIFG
uniref:peptidoglycan DD-metalloendopeptidase family protein n=1 Tax=Xenorhabdus sp. TH1 TaxID=3130166 RepID=UPI0040401B60